MLKIFILGHSGMLGNAVFAYFSKFPENYLLYTTKERWGDEKFKEVMKHTDADFIVNCIGAIPQKYAKEPNKYVELNVDLPVFLETLGKNVVHPSTDCEFSGNLPVGQKYQKNSLRDADDEYGKSKAHISKRIEEEFQNTKIIRTSIIGHELSGSFALLDWALGAKDAIRGYTDHYWNGITTLKWAQLCEGLITNWDQRPKLNQYGTQEVETKIELLKTIYKVYKKDGVISSFETGQKINKALESDVQLPSIEIQLLELKASYGR